MERGYSNLFIMYLGHLITKKVILEEIYKQKKISFFLFFKRFLFLNPGNSL